ncbi:hypothetical protein EG329_013449 [Mollisiaceae sp. DMI_Dod_QoI]|nr:hypothetical protein EG329_013449 [Helotiales sp. DMI_Dod_QoI]
MARPFPNTFEQDSPMTPQSASSISYQTNVNRQKTKKWAQAPAVNYGGDDWGDDDDFDPPPPPISKPTGLRQQGQGLQSSAKPESPAYDNGKKYGDLPPLPGASDPRGRRNSFDADDEKRNFSSSTIRQQSPAATTPLSGAPATRFSQITGAPSPRNASGPPTLQIQTQQPPAPAGLRKAIQVVSPISGSPHPDILKPGRSNTGESSIVSPASGAPSSSSDFQARRDFSPSAVPPPLATRASPAPQSATDSPSSRFPARKSSLSQSMGSPLTEVTRSTLTDSPTKPWVPGRSASPGAATRSPATPTGKALPFIRPADIYRRAEEERRQSLESGRPSMESATGARSSDRSDSPAIPHLKEKSSSDSLGGNGRRRTSFEGDDGSDSGRRLMPMLEPVRERKSEYGFDGVNVNDQVSQSGALSDAPARESLEPMTIKDVDEEEARRLSISPKLPDLTRISGFGVDMFSQPKPEAPEIPSAIHAETTPTASTSTLSPAEDDLTLHTQRSFGFRSVVNQAFERSDDSSVPHTPASNTGSGVRRTDSESTGTTGISPIMSRVPSGAVPESRNRDTTNPSILEVVNEPVSPDVSIEKEVGDTQRGREVPGFKPGYRRDISTPRSDNSPARTPDLAKTKIITGGQHAIVSETSPERYSSEGEPLQPPRPITEREGSFRPSLPGGWTSYATTAQSETPPQAPSIRAHTPVHEVSPIENEGEGGDLDITPTTAKRELHQSSTPTAVAGAAFAGATGAALGQHDRDSQIPSTGSPSSRVLQSNSSLPTPDPAMAPGGNLYSTETLDPRLLPKLEQAPAETQLRPDAVNRDVSRESSAAPTPPRKDSPQDIGDDDSEYSTKPSVPLIPRSPVEVETNETLMPPVRPQMLPALSTNTYPNDEENDKLRKEIVKSLSPRPSDANNENMLSDELDESNYSKKGHESSYLPREYDNYWASTSDDQVGTGPASAPVEEHVKKVEAFEPETTIVQKHEEVDPPIIAPLSPRRSAEPALEPPRPSLPSRFSWEESNEKVNIVVPNDQVSEVSAVSTPVHAPQSTEEATVVPNTALSEPQPTARQQDGTLEAQIQAHPDDHMMADEHQKVLITAAGAAALGAATAARYTSTLEESSGRRLSLAEEKDPRVSSHPVSPTPPEDEHPAHAAQHYFTPSPNQNSPIPAPSTVSPVASPVLQQQFSAPMGKLLGFRDIIKMPSSQERIHGFNLTRQRFATMDSGLNDWMVYLQTQHPEHADASSSYGSSRLSAPSGSSRLKFGKNTGGTAPPLQKPYYQHWLNASSPTTPTTPVSRPGPPPNIASGSQQGFSSNTGKLSSHQVQAKGLELLHSAGIFGGKAGKAGKGLLAKGKSKFRGGGDKTSPPPKPKNENPKQERRTSWGLPLNISRSSGRPDGSARQSREFTPQPERPRASTTTSNRSMTAPQLPNISPSDSLGIMSGALPSTNGIPAQEREEPATIRQVQEPQPGAYGAEARDTLGVPAPIGKYQPSWDPYNATPIAEEEGFQYEERPKHRHLSSDAGTRQGSLAVPQGAPSRSERSNSDDSHFYSAHEEVSDFPNERVMAPSNPDTKDVLATAQPAQELKQEPKVEADTRKSLDAPVTSILNRPRGSSYEIPSPPNSAKGPAHKPAEPSVVAAAPVQFAPSLPKPVPAETERQTGTSSFLPPIRRTSTFGLGFGSRHTRPRFALEDDDEQNLPDNGAKAIERTPVGPELLEEITAPPQPSFSLPQQKPRIRAATDVPIDTRESSSITQPQPPISQQAPVSSDSTLQNPRPLSFVHTSGAGEVLNTPFRGNSQPATAGESILREPPTYPQPAEWREQPQRQHLSGEQQSASDVQYDATPQGGASRPPLIQSGSSEYSQQSTQSQRTINAPQAPLQQTMSSRAPDSSQLPEQNSRAMLPPAAPQPPQLSTLVSPRASDVLQRPEFRESQVEWRPNRPRAVEPPQQVSPTFWKEVDIPPPRNSWEPQRQRGNSGSSQNYSQRPEGQYNERATWNGPPLQQSPYPQPPSSAQRYPGLFKPGQPGIDMPRDSADLPANYYQAPIARADAFLPRQQTNEYQIPGVGPPPDDPRPATSKRNSGFFKEIGGKLSRASSRDRGNSMSRDGGAPSPVRLFESNGNEYAESSVASEGEQEQRKRRSSFFGNLSRNSTSGLGPPQSRESVIAHNSASRTDLVASSQPSPTHQDRKRSIFGGSSKDPKEKANKLVRTSTGSMDAPGKKHRFSGLSSMFSKTSQSTRGSVQERPQATREVSYHDRQPIESPQLNIQRFNADTPPPGQARAPSQTRQVLQKLTSSTSPRTSPRPENKTRRSSGPSLLGGLMGRKPNQQDRGSDDSRSQGSSSQPQTVPRTLPAAQTYTDLQEQQQVMIPPAHEREVPFQDPSMRVANRGRHISREPQYDSVPIPGGYSLVRGQGAVPVPTEYDPRGLSRVQQIDPRYVQRPSNGAYYQNGSPMQSPPQQYTNDGRYGPQPQQPPQGSQDARQLHQPKPHVGAIETYESYAARSTPHRLSREDLLARSPPKSLEGQQRPYQISLPGGNEEDSRPLPIDKDPNQPGSVKTVVKQPQLQHDAIQRLQQPTLRHPESPAGYPLPEDTVFSPVEPRANDIPPPPPPQWPSRTESHHSNASQPMRHERQASLSTMEGDLDRSNTRRTAVSAVSGLSGSRPQSGGLNVPNRQISDATETDRDRRHIASPSPSPPSPLPGTPERNMSPDLRHQPIDERQPQVQAQGKGQGQETTHLNDIRTTELVTRPSREDLYNASPRLPKPGHLLPKELTMNYAPTNGNGNANIAPASRANVQALGKENMNVGRSVSAIVKPTEPIMQPDGHIMRAASSSQAQEEKILYQEGVAGRAELPVVSDDGPAEMSATSYPGQEWNPYGAGAWDDGFD